MISKDPIFPYKNLFITARPGMGASTLVANIANKYLEEGKRCLIFEATDHFLLTYNERFRIIKEDLDIDSLHPLFSENGNLTVAYNYFFESEALLTLVDKYDADVVVYEASRYLRDQKKELAELVEELKSRGKTFIFVTHIKRKRYPLMYIQRITPSASRHHKAIPYFDATAIIYRDAYYRVGEENTEEIRIYEQGQKKYRAVPVEFDFQKQRISRK